MTERTITRRATGGVQWRRAPTGTWTPAKRTLFLETLGMTSNVTYSAQTAGMNPAGAYKLRHRDAGFAEQWEQALSDSYARLEEQALECALRTLTGNRRLDGSEVAEGEGGPVLQERTILTLMGQRRQSVAVAHELAVRQAAAQAAAEAGGDVVQVQLLEKLQEIRVKMIGSVIGTSTDASDDD